MSGVVNAVTGMFKKPKKQGPTAGQIAVQKANEKKAFEAETDADRAVAAVSTLQSRRKSLAFQDKKKKSTLGG